MSSCQLLFSPQMIYFVSSVAVLYCPSEQTQRHYTAHTEDIKVIMTS